MNKGLMCVSICAETADDMIATIRRAEVVADVIEIRFDHLHANQIEPTFRLIGTLDTATPLIATFRPLDQGGVGEISRAEREAFWQKTCHTIWADVEEDIFPFALNWKKRIVSYHDLKGAPGNLSTVLESLHSSGADVFKIATTPNDITDSIPVWDLLKRTKVGGQNIIPIAMGEAGKWTRILGLAHGSYLTYASLSEGQETADGQITVKDLTEIYRVKELNLDTKVYGVIGDPVSGSSSPFMHNAAFVELQINAVFIPLQVKNLGEFLRRMVKAATREVELNFRGFSVTMPHKQAIITHLDAIDVTAERIGAVNTVKIDGDKLVGYNTDAYGFMTALNERFGCVDGALVAVFGAGGAARACIFALKEQNANVTVVARDAKQSNALAEEFEISSSKISKTNPSEFDILVNATPIGMKGPLENESLFTSEQLKGVKFVYDLVTRGEDTPLVREAKKANIPAIGGMEMLLHQGAKQFEIWTERDAPIEKMRTALSKRIQPKQQ